MSVLTETETQKIDTWHPTHTEALRLDRLFPGWAYRIDLDKLDMAHPLFCVLGQATGNFDNALARITDDGYQPSGVYALYGSRWKAEILARRER